MFKNYLKIAVRNLFKHKIYSFINVAGLAIGIACCFLILTYVQDELSYDRYHEKADRIYRLIEIFDVSGKIEKYPSASFGVTPALLSEFPGELTPVRFFKVFKQVPLISYEQNSFYEERFFFVDSTVFDIFTFPFVSGDPETALDAPYSIVITQEMADKYFGAQDPFGKRLRFEGQLDFNITGVLKNLPQNSHFQFDFLASMRDMKRIFEVTGTPTGWLRSMYWNPCYTYLLLDENASAQEIEERFPAFVTKYFPEEIRDAVSFKLQALTDIRLHSDLDEEIAAQSDVVYVYIFSLIALFVLLIACVNFMNLSTARSINRAREVGMRKVLGAERRQLIRQFLGEAFVLSLLAVLLAIVLIELFLPMLNSVTGKQLTVRYFDDWTVPAMLAGFTVLVGCLAGGYPAFFISSYQPAKVLKSQSTSDPRGAVLRKGLVVFQFAISIILIIGTVVVFEQLSYLRTRKLGFDKEQVVVFSLRGTPFRQEPNTLKNELLKHSAISLVTVSSDIPGRPVNVYPFGIEGSDERFDLPALFVDHDFPETMGIEITQGRAFSKELASDSTEAFILNEAAVKKFGWDEPIGQGFRFGNNRKGQIVGVVQDFNYASLHQKVHPLVMHVWPFWYENMIVRIRPGEVESALTFMEQKWAELTGGRPFEYLFLDENIDRLYRAEEQMSRIFSGFFLLAIFIASLGLFGLAAFSAERRSKEIGIRKVLGASVASILSLLSKDFVKLVVLAAVIAGPIAYFIMERWLQDFAYRIDITWWVFLGAAGLAMMIALLTVSAQALRAALANPVDTLKYE